jgi:poly(A) polymerase
MPTASDKETGSHVSDPSGIEPKIIPRSEHQVSRKNIDREALKVLHRLRDAGFTAYLVGGGVRDLYLGKTPKDFDISTDARPGQLRKLFRNSRLIGRRFRLVQVFFRGNKIIEVSTFRRRSEFDIKNNTEEENGQVEVLPANNTYGTPADDAFRRDLTINGLFYEITTFSIIDYTGGVEDLDRGIIRIIGDPDRRITRDPARMLRVIRHAARNNFTIEQNTWLAIKKHQKELNLCPVSRIRDELLKDLRGGACRPWAELAMDCGIFEVLFPFYAPVLARKSANHNTREELLNTLAVVDRMQGQQHEGTLPEHILFSMLLIPWAVAELNIMEIALKGAEAYRFSRQIRARLDEILGHLNIKRSIKETITLLLANINLLNRHENRIPKWLKKKSYYPDCKQLYAIYGEARGGAPVDPAMVTALAETAPPKPAKGRRQKASRRRGRPAFARGSNDGVFGLKSSKGRKK